MFFRVYFFKKVGYSVNSLNTIIFLNTIKNGKPNFQHAIGQRK